MSRSFRSFPVAGSILTRAPIQNDTEATPPPASTVTCIRKKYQVFTGSKPTREPNGDGTDPSVILNDRGQGETKAAEQEKKGARSRNQTMSLLDTGRGSSKDLALKHLSSQLSRDYTHDHAPRRLSSAETPGESKTRDRSVTTRDKWADGVVFTKHAVHFGTPKHNLQSTRRDVGETVPHAAARGRWWPSGSCVLNHVCVVWSWDVSLADANTG